MPLVGAAARGKGEMMTRPAGMRVGELARRTGLSIRTLHYYDEIGLLAPPRRSAAGHRLYAAGDIARLQQITSLRQLGFSLGEIREWLGRPGFSPLRVVELHLARLGEQIAAQQRLRARLEALAVRFRATETVSVAEFMHTIEGMTMVEKYYTPEQLAELAERRRTVGEARIREVEAEWPRLMEEVRAEMEAGTDPTDARVLALARRWMGLVEEFTGGNPGIRQSLGRMYEQEETIHGVDIGAMRPMMEYIGKAIAAAKTAE